MASKFQKTFWDLMASTYDDLYQSLWSIHEDNYVQQRLEWLQPLKNPRVLDLGCGTGLGYELCKKANPTIKYVGVDISPKMLQQFKIKHPEAETYCMNIDTLDTEAFGQFDVVVSFFTSLSYVESLELTLERLDRLVRPGGYVRLSVLNRTSLRRMARLRLHHTEWYGTRNASAAVQVRTYSLPTMKRLCRSRGWTIVQVDSFSAFAQLKEDPKLWALDRKLCQYAPWLGHTIDILAQVPAH